MIYYNFGGEKQRMKTCINCGADYNKELQYCPYCGMQDEEFVKRKHADRMNQLKRENLNIKKLPQIISKKAMKYLLICFACFLAVFFVSLIIVSIGSRINVSFKANKEKKNIEVMDEFLANGDYQGFYDYYEKVDYSYAIYDKYEEIERLYYLYSTMWWEFDIIIEYGGKVSDTSIKEDFVDAMCILHDISSEADELINNNARFGNEEHLKAIRDISYEDFKKFMLVDDDFVEKVISVPMEETEPEIYSEFAGQLLDNLQKVNFGREE